MTSIQSRQTSWRWAVVMGWLVCSVTAVAAQEGRWERVTALGVQAAALGDYPEAARQFQAALPLADAGRLAPSVMQLAAVYEAQERYPEAARLYRRALVLQEQVMGPDDPQLVEVLEALAALDRTMHPVRSLLPWSPARQLAARAQRIREHNAQALILDAPWGPLDAHQVVSDGGHGE
jgi:tetratricopeptide (TPR) repeat protein